MKWIEKIFRGKEKEVETFLQLSEIESWLSEKGDDSEFVERIERSYSHIEKLSGDLADDARDLSIAQANEATPPKLLRAGLAARGEMVKQLESLCEKIKPPRKRDLESAASHHWTLLKGLERTVTTFGRAKRYSAALFPKNIEKIDTDLAKVSRHLVELEGEIDRRRKVQEEIWHSKNLLKELEIDLPDIDKLEKDLKESEEKLKGTISLSSSKDKELKQLASSEEGKRSEELKEILEKKKNDLEQARNEMASLIAPLTKALARIAKQGSSNRLDLKHRGIFEQLSALPTTVQDSDITGALEELGSHLAILGLKDRKKEKVLDHIDHLIEKNSLQNAKYRQSELENDIKKLEKDLFESSRKSLRLKEEQSEIRRSMKSLEASRDQDKKKLATLREKATKKESELKERLRKVANGPIKIDTSRGKG